MSPPFGHFFFTVYQTYGYRKCDAVARLHVFSYGDTLTTEAFAMTSLKQSTEEFTISGESLVAKVKELVQEGNIRRIIIKNERDETLIELPVTVAAVGALLVPALAAVGTIAALVTKCTIVVERRSSLSS